MITDLLKGLAARRRGIGRRRTRGETSTALTVEYAPKRDGRPDPGEVVWTWVTFEDDPTQGKDRPVVIIGRAGGQLAGIALTTKDHGPAGDRIAVGTGDWDRERRPSFAKVDRILVVAVDDVRREGAAFDPERFRALIDEVRRRHGGSPDVRSTRGSSRTGAR